MANPLSFIVPPGYEPEQFNFKSFIIIMIIFPAGSLAIMRIQFVTLTVYF